MEEGKQKNRHTGGGPSVEGEAQGAKTPHTYPFCPMLALEGVSHVETKSRNKAQRPQGHPHLPFSRRHPATNHMPPLPVIFLFPSVVSMATEEDSIHK